MTYPPEHCQINLTLNGFFVMAALYRIGTQEAYKQANEFLGGKFVYLKGTANYF